MFFLSRETFSGCHFLFGIWQRFSGAATHHVDTDAHPGELTKL